MIMLLPLVTVLVLILGLSSDAAPPKRKILKNVDNRPLCPCGSSIRSKSTRVVGGVNAIEGQFPYATSFYHKRSADGLPFCGGTLISDRHILTAAHCLEEDVQDISSHELHKLSLDVDEISLYVSEFDVEKTGAAQLRKPKALKVHPRYNSTNYQNDIAIIELDKPVRWSNGVKASWIAPPDMRLRAGTPVSVHGWGLLSSKGGRPAILQTLEMPVVSNEDCQKDYRNKIIDSMMCAGGKKGHDSCMGDSGGGLTVRLNNEHALVGIVSFGKTACADSNVAGVYTRLGLYLNWVYEQTRNSSCKPCRLVKKKA